jgi:hypothetical protein
MGQYWKVVNLDKKEYLDPHKLGAGLKLWEQLANYPGTGTALIVLCAAMPEARGGGDLDLEDNWHGPERTFPEYNTSPARMPDAYPEIAARTIGRWAGDRIALVGDYAEDGDLAPEHHASTLYEQCGREGAFQDVTDDVCAVIEHELGGKFVGEGWRDWQRGDR